MNAAAALVSRIHTEAPTALRLIADQLDPTKGAIVAAHPFYIKVMHGVDFDTLHFHVHVMRRRYLPFERGHTIRPHVVAILHHLDADRMAVLTTEPGGIVELAYVHVDSGLIEIEYTNPLLDSDEMFQLLELSMILDTTQGETDDGHPT